MNLIAFKLVDAISSVLAAIEWPTKKVISEDSRDDIRHYLTDNYCIILTRHRGHLTNHLIAFSHWLMSGKWGYYGHVLMNVENTVNTDDYCFVEAVREGVKYSTFSEVLDPQVASVAILKPKGMTLQEWTEALDKAKSEIGKQYDSVFDLSNDQKLSCVELVRVALQSIPDYATQFAKFEEMIKANKNLDPQMFYECSDFEVEYEIRMDRK